MIRLEGVTRAYRGGPVAVRDVSLLVAEGETVSLIGTSGCGKTTTLKMINRLLEPTSGRVLVGGRDVAELDPIALRRGIGYVIQRVGLLPHRTVSDNISLLMRLEGWPAPRMRARVEELLTLVGLDTAELGPRLPAELSGGQQQRVGVARALALDPPIILMDEPFGALDPISRQQIQEEFIRIRRAFHKTIVMVTHDLDEAFRLSDRIVLMHAGEVVHEGTARDFRSTSASPFVAEFVRRQVRGSLDSFGIEEVVVPGTVSPTDAVLPEGTTIKEALALLLSLPQQSRIGVVSEGGQVLGVVTRESLLDVV